VRRALDLLGPLAAATAGLVALLLLQPFSRQLALHLYLVMVAGIVLAAAVGATRAALPAPGRSAFDEALRRREPEQRRPAQLERIERAVTLGTTTAFDFHARLRPLLREVAAARLARARGVDLDSPAGRAALGDDAWELLRPDREPPDDRFGPGLDPHRLRRLVALLETLDQ
jgi:hypothetical protein